MIGMRNRIESNKKSGKRVALYVRVSKDEQAKEGFSIDAQKKTLMALVESKNGMGDKWVVVDTYVDEGRSAFKKEGKHRPEFNRMMREIDRWDIVMAVRLDRFWRRVVPALSWISKINEKGKDIIAGGDTPIDTTTATGRAMLSILLVMAEWESATTQERVLSARKQKFNSEGDKWATRPPFGYEIVKKKLVVNPDESKGVVMAFNLALEWPAREVAFQLNRAGYRTKSGKYFSNLTMLHILKNPAYAGYVYRDGVLRRNEHEALVSDDLFNEVQRALYNRIRNRGRENRILEVGEDTIRVVKKGTVGCRYIPVE